MNPHKNFLGILSILMLSLLTACTFMGRATVPEAEDRIYQTVGTEFATYVRSSDWTDQDKTEAQVVLDDWRVSGSTMATYEYVAPRYTVFIENDPFLTDDAINARELNLLSWKVRLEEQAKLPPPVSPFKSED